MPIANGVKSVVDALDGCFVGLDVEVLGCASDELGGLDALLSYEGRKTYLLGGIFEYHHGVCMFDLVYASVCAMS